MSPHHLRRRLEDSCSSTHILRTMLNSLMLCCVHHRLLI